MRMFKKLSAAFVVLIVSFIQAALPAFSDSAADDMSEMRKEIAALKGRVVVLESKLQQSEMKVSSLEKERVAPETGLPAQITSFAKEIEVHGFVDTSYIFNANTPVTPNARTNALRVFDTEANGFMLNMTEINIEKPISMESPLGFRVDLDYGRDARLIHSNGLGNAGDEFDLEQAFVQFYVPFSLPLMNALNFKIGKFVTLHGAEVIESVDNWNFSRSYMFGYAIPFTHTGVRAYYKPFADVPVDSYIGIVNGWDQVLDLNKAKTIEAQVSVAPWETLSLAVGGMFGAERADSDKDMRNLIDFVATYKATDKLTLKVNYDYGWERNAASVAAGGMNGKDASWDGVAAYAKYDILDWWSIAARGEYFHDRDGVRTGVLTSAAMPITDLDIWEFTLTNEFKLWQNLIARLEYRYDKASGQAFTKDKLTANYQNTIAAELIAKF